MNLFGIYLLEIAQGFYVGVAVVCFLPLIVTVPYDFLFPARESGRIGRI